MLLIVIRPSVLTLEDSVLFSIMTTNLLFQHRQLIRRHRFGILYPAVVSLLYGSYSDSTNFSTRRYATYNLGREDNNNNDNGEDIVGKIWRSLQDQSPADIMKNVPQLLEQALKDEVPVKVSYGTGLGFCSGFAVKKVGKFGAFIFGTAFALFQSLSYAGYITINYDKVGQDLSKVLDLNADGKLNDADGKALYDKAMDVIGFNIPTGSGFAAGFALGLRYG